MRRASLARASLLALAACNGARDRTARAPRPDAVTGADAYSAADRGGEPRFEKPDPPARPARKAGPSIRVVWEALAVETDRVENPRNRRPVVRGIGGNELDLKVILVNESFVATPEQDAENRGERAVGRVARISNEDMDSLLAGFDRAGFFDHAKSTGSLRGTFSSDRARGRVTVDRDGTSVTLLSMRGLGLQQETRAIPQIYAQAKYAVQVMKNITPTLRVSGARVGKVDPKAASRSSAPAPPARPPASPECPDDGK